MRINANGISINYQIDGPEGAPWLVFSNSLVTNLSMWDDQVADLKSSFRILRYDQRGHGGTQVTDGKYSFDMLTADAIGLLDALSITRTHFAGISMGGMTAMFLAERHPERCDGVIACDFGPASTPVSAQQWQERIDLATAKGMEGLAEATVARWFPPEFIAAKAPVIDRTREMIRTTPFKGFAGCAAALSDYDMRPGLGAVRKSDPAHRRHQGRHAWRHPAGQGRGSGLKAGRARRRGAFVEPGAAEEFQSGHPRFFEGHMMRAPRDGCQASGRHS